VWTQNIDCLESLAGLESDQIIEAHGSFRDADCLRCSHTYAAEEIREEILQGRVVRCQRDGCIGQQDALVGCSGINSLSLRTCDRLFIDRTRES
jgi:NAD-dependent SIR2 family protein deacetylase